MKANYQQDYVIKDVSDGDEWYSITTTDSTGFGLKKKYGVVPVVGDTVTLHTHGGSFGTIRGIDLNGAPVFWKTDVELEASRQKWLRENEERKVREFEEDKARMDAEYEALPDCFRARIDKFRANNPDFRRDYESYELFCCTQAVEIAKGCGTPEKVKAFAALPWAEQMNVVPALSDGHSGNTFGMACKLAYWYLEQPNAVTTAHGSLSVLVGSDEYGDVPQSA